MCKPHLSSARRLPVCHFMTCHTARAASSPVMTRSLDWSHARNRDLLAVGCARTSRLVPRPLAQQPRIIRIAAFRLRHAHSIRGYHTTAHNSRWLYRASRGIPTCTNTVILLRGCPRTNSVATDWGTTVPAPLSCGRRPTPYLSCYPSGTT